MSVNTGYKKVKRHVKESDGTYTQISTQTTADNVMMVEDGEITTTTIQDKINNLGINKVLTQAEYDALSPEEQVKEGVVYYISDAGIEIPVVILTKAQYEALGEVVKTDGKLYVISDDDYEAPYTNFIEITKEEYEALPETTKNTNDYFITDECEIADASVISYDNSESGLESENVQAAISELNDTLSVKDCSDEIVSTNEAVTSINLYGIGNFRIMNFNVIPYGKVSASSWYNTFITLSKSSKQEAVCGYVAQGNTAHVNDNISIILQGANVALNIGTVSYTSGQYFRVTICYFV